MTFFVIAQFVISEIIWKISYANIHNFLNLSDYAPTFTDLILSFFFSQSIKPNTISEWTSLKVRYHVLFLFHARVLCVFIQLLKIFMHFFTYHKLNHNKLKLKWKLRLKLEMKTTFKFKFDLKLRSR